MKFNQPNGSEAMIHIPWDAALHAGTNEVSAAMELYSQADVARTALQIVPRIVFDSITSEHLDSELAGTLESAGLPNLSSTEAEPTKVTILDPYVPGDDAYKTVVRVSRNDLEKGKLAAAACGLNVEEFAYKATRMIVDLERQTPGYTVRIKAAHAEEDIVARKVLGLTDIQPWGEEDYHDYGLPEDD